MQAASRESYAAAVAKLAPLVTGDRPVPLAGIADEILSVAQLLVREPRLRRALSDPARPGEDRVALIRSVVDGKVSADALALVSTLISGRWSAPSELVDAAERLGVETLLASAESAGDLGEVEDELFRFGQVVDGDARLSGALGDSTAPVEQRAALIADLLGGKVRPATLRLATLALGGYGGRGFAASLTRLVEAAAERRDRQVAYVTVAAPLTEADEERLGVRLAGMYGREVALKVSVDPRILGGVSVRVGNDLYDGTVLRRLNDTRTALTGT